MEQGIEFGNFVIWIDKPREEVLGRVNQFMMKVYGRILESSFYPRTYIGDSTETGALRATKSDGSTGDVLFVFIDDEETTWPDGKRGAGVFRYLRTLTSSNGNDRRERRQEPTSTHERESEKLHVRFSI